MKINKSREIQCALLRMQDPMKIDQTAGEHVRVKDGHATRNLQPTVNRQPGYRWEDSLSKAHIKNLVIL